jgi:hypothetical protein
MENEGSRYSRENRLFGDDGIATLREKAYLHSRILLCRQSTEAGTGLKFEYDDSL